MHRASALCYERRPSGRKTKKVTFFAPEGPAYLAQGGSPVNRMHDLDTRTKQYGREIFARLDRQGPVLFTRAWLEDKLMGLGMHDPALKVQLLDRKSVV